MSGQHTPGPWSAGGSDMTLATWVKGPDRKRICTMKEGPNDWPNAKLIAAAPDLLEALRVAYSDMQRTPGHTIDMLGRIEAAIQKATQ